MLSFDKAVDLDYESSLEYLTLNFRNLSYFSNIFALHLSLVNAAVAFFKTLSLLLQDSDSYGTTSESEEDSKLSYFPDLVPEFPMTF